jgi:putative pyruvate formate lyase activating enzyme
VDDPAFCVRAQDFEPGYLKLYRRGELQQRIEQAVAGLAHCQVCPRRCGKNRLAAERGACQTGRYAHVSSYFPHLGEEDCLRGWQGSGTIFFAQCNLRCVFCQNNDISQEGFSPETRPAQLAEMMLALQARGCHNLNFVTPTHVTPQWLEALPLAVEGGLRLPIVYNTSAYDAVETLRLLEGIVDIYMPDFKIWDAASAESYLTARDYPEVARQAIREMHRQVGELKLDEDGLARRGVLVRHLVLPSGAAGSSEVMRFLAQELSPHTFVNVMAQYHPAGKVGRDRFAQIDRRITPEEYAAAVTAARAAGLSRLD